MLQQIWLFLLMACSSLILHDAFGNSLDTKPAQLSEEEPSFRTKVQPAVSLQPANCMELKHLGHTDSGIYTIYPRFWYNVLPFKVYCDMHTDGGGWIVFQRRGNYGHPSESFYRTWDDYKDGFGKLTQQFWLGNDYISVLTKQDEVALRIDMEDFEGQKRYASYSVFQVASADQEYTLTVDKYKGNAGDSFIIHSGEKFATFDKDNAHNCSATYKGAWWYQNCHRSNLNGMYLFGTHKSHADGIEWYEWHGHYYSLKRTEMKIRPLFGRPQ